MMTPLFPKEHPQTNTPHPFPGMETRTGTNHVKTVSLIETVLQKNRVVSYNAKTIYTLLLWEVVGNEIERYAGIGSSIGGKGWGVYHAR